MTLFSIRLVSVSIQHSLEENRIWAVSVVLEGDDWHYVISKLRKVIQSCYEKSYCQLLEVISKIENRLRKQT